MLPSVAHRASTACRSRAQLRLNRQASARREAARRDHDLVQRVEKLEQTVDSSAISRRTTRLEVRMGNVETQIVHLRTKCAMNFLH
jgi:hypothetical protein